MWSIAATAILALLIFRMRPRAIILWPVLLLVIYCLLGNGVAWLIKHSDLGETGFVFDYVSSETLARTDFVMGLGALALGVGILYGSRGMPLRNTTSESVARDHRMANRGGLRLVLLGVPLAAALAVGWLKNLHAGSSEYIRLALLVDGYWPVIIALFGWVVPFVCLHYAACISGFIAKDRALVAFSAGFVAIALVLSVLVGFRTYFIFSVLVIFVFYSVKKKLSKKYLLVGLALMVGAFVLVTYFREGSASDGALLSGMLISVFRRLSLEPIGAADYLFSIIDREGLYYGATLVMDLMSKLPGRQVTFSGQLAVEAGFVEGLTLTPSGILELYANFASFGFVLLLFVGIVAGSRLKPYSVNSFNGMVVRLLTFLFLIEFIMGGSAAFFDLAVRTLLYYWAMRIK